MSRAAFLALVADPLKRADLCTQIAITICKATGGDPKKPMDRDGDPPNMTEQWTAFHNDARIMVIDTEDRLRTQIGESPLIRTVEFTPQSARDGCEVCHGARGGAPGNENIINGVKMCDYCHVDHIDARDASR